MNINQPCTILIADDNDEYRYVIEHALKNLGHDCLLAMDGLEAVNFAFENIPDLILLDINMPNMDGLTALKKIRSNPKLKSIPIIMISTLMENETVIECLEAGADDYVTKPFDRTVLKARIVNNLNRRIYQKKEKELLEKTLIGSIQVLSEILESLDPKIFSKISRLKKHAKYIAEQLNVKEDKWVMDMATHFSLIGCIYHPRDFVLKALTGRILHAEEKKIFEQHSLHGYKILSKIPRLERVSEIIKYSFKNFDGTGIPDEDRVGGEYIPIGSRILRAVWEYELLFLKHETPEDTISSIKNLSGKVDPQIIPLLEQLFYTERTGDIIEVRSSDLEIGMIFMEDIYTKNKVKVAGMWQEVTESLLDRIVSIAISFGIREPFKVIYPNQPKKKKEN